MPKFFCFYIQANLQEGERYKGYRNFEEIENFILTKIPSKITILTPETWQQKQNEHSQWLLFMCSENTDCIESKTQIKLAAALVSYLNLKFIPDKDTNFCIPIGRTSCRRRYFR